jgi:hypothetical protein
MFVYYNEQRIRKNNGNIANILEKLGKPKWNYGRVDVVMFLDEVYFYRRYNERLYDKLLDDIELYLATGDEFAMSECLNDFHDFVHTLPINYKTTHGANMSRLEALIGKPKDLNDTVNEYRYYV